MGATLILFSILFLHLIYAEPAPTADPTDFPTWQPTFIPTTNLTENIFMEPHDEDSDILANVKRLQRHNAYLVYSLVLITGIIVSVIISIFVYKCIFESNQSTKGYEINSREDSVDSDHEAGAILAK